MHRWQLRATSSHQIEDGKDALKSLNFFTMIENALLKERLKRTNSLASFLFIIT